MMKICDHNRLVNRQLLIVSFLLMCLLPLASAYAVDIDFNKMLFAMKRHSGPIIRFIVATAYVIGLWFIFGAIVTLKKLGQQTMMQHQSISGPLIKLIVGLLLLYLPGVIDVSLWTIWGYGVGEESLMTYEPGLSDPFGPAKEGAIAIVRVVGYVSFVRGFVILSRSGAQSGAQPGTFGKGLMHIIGGMLAINIVGTIRIISNTLGFGGI